MRKDKWIKLPNENLKYAEEEIEVKLPQEEVGIETPPIWKRAVAYLIDLIFFYFSFYQIFMIIYLPRVGLLFSSAEQMKSFLSTNPEAMIKVIVGLVGILFILLFYFVLLEKNFKTTVGKRIMGISLSGEITYKNVIIRNLTKSILLPFLLIDVLGYLYIGKRFSELKTKDIYSTHLLIEYGEI